MDTGVPRADGKNTDSATAEPVDDSLGSKDGLPVCSGILLILSFFDLMSNHR